MRRLVIVIGAAVSALALAGPPAHAWTAPITISSAGDVECSVPAIAKGADGKILVAYRRKSPDWRIFYRERSGAGVWGPVETVSVPWTERPDICEDPHGRPHMFYTSSQANASNDLYEAYRLNGSWVVSQFTNTSGYFEDYPRVVVDSLGRMHLVYTKSPSSHEDAGDVIYRVWDGSWSAESVIGSTQNKNYYHRPDIAVDSANNVHVVWEQNQYTLVYRKKTGSTWSAQATIGTTTHFFSFAKIAAPTPNNIVAVTFDQVGSARTIKAASSTNGGGAWSALQYLNDGHYPNMESDSSGNAHVVYSWSTNMTAIGHRTWNVAGWGAAQQATPSGAPQQWADVTIDASGAVHCVFVEGNGISYVTSAPDTIPPQPVTGFSATASDGSVSLRWTNPTDPDLAGTKICYRTDRPPFGPADGTMAYGGAGQTFSHRGLANGVTYYYAAFSYDFAANHAAPANVAATPHVLACSDVKAYADGALVDLMNKAVTSAWTADGCLYVGDRRSGSGVRVVCNPVGFVVGDVVNVSGTVTTRVLSGYPAERQIASATVVKVSPAVNSPAVPLGMRCSQVGGAAIPPYAPGVKDGTGTNNIGSLVKVIGNVTLVLSSYIYVDDGSSIQDVSGRIGIMVKCPGTPPVAVGDMVSVAGVAEGSIPAGWSTNRRYIHMRDWNDLVVYQP